MLQSLGFVLREALALGADIMDVNSWQMALRTVLVYAVTLTAVRLGAKRFLSQATAFDAVVGIMVGSIMSRAINGSAPLVPSLVSGGVLIAAHWLLAWVAARTDRFGRIAKGEPKTLVKDGRVDHDALRSSNITERDLNEALRISGGVTDVDQVELAVLERNGGISVIPRDRAPSVSTVAVEEGVQTIRIEIG